VQDTGFRPYLPVGEGLLVFDGLEDAAVALAEVERDYPHHARVAAALAARHFDSDRVLAELLNIAGV